MPSTATPAPLLLLLSTASALLAVILRRRPWRIWSTGRLDILGLSGAEHWGEWFLYLDEGPHRSGLPIRLEPKSWQEYTLTLHGLTPTPWDG